MSTDNFREQYQEQLRNIRIPSLTMVVDEEAKQAIQRNPDAQLWLDKVGYSTRPSYVRALSYFLKCVNISDPSRLLDLKSHEDQKQRFFPAETLVEYWAGQARRNGVSPAKIKKTLDAVRSFFKSARVALVEVKCTYKPKPKASLSDEDLRTFRDGFSWYGKILFDFFLSVPLRDGQFQKCPNCKEEFFPRWQNIETYPTIEAYSPFIIKPQKGLVLRSARVFLR